MSLACIKKAGKGDIMNTTDELLKVRECRSKIYDTVEGKKLKKHNDKLFEQYEKKTSEYQKKILDSKNDINKANKAKKEYKKYIDNVYIKTINKKDALTKKLCDKELKNISPEVKGKLRSLYRKELDCHKKIKNKSKIEKEWIKLLKEALKNIDDNNMLRVIW